MWQLGSLGYRVGQLAFDTWKVVGFLFAKNLVIYFRWPARFSQLRAPLVEQVVPHPPPPRRGAAGGRIAPRDCCIGSGTR